MRLKISLKRYLIALNLSVQTEVTMNTKRKTIGRTFNGTQLSTEPVKKFDNQRFTLSSGKTAVFNLEHISAENVAEKTFVQLVVNGREQNSLTEASLSDITRTIRLQQFFPAIGRRVDEKIEILDGSRRRAAALLCNVGLTVLVTNAELSIDDARQLAADIQTAKEHNLREIGLRLLQLRSNGMSQKEIAEIEKLSTAKVTRAIQAASVPSEIITLFPVPSELTYPDYKFLLNMHSQILKHAISLENLLENVNHLKEQYDNFTCIPPDEQKNIIINFFKQEFNSVFSQDKNKKVILNSLWTFNEKDMYARKRTKDRSFSYEFNRMPKALQDELDRMIQIVMRKHFQE